MVLITQVATLTLTGILGQNKGFLKIMGIDRRWRDIGCQRAYEILDRESLTQITDVACGTGDLLIYWQKNAQKLDIQVEKYIGVDPSVKMLEIAKEKVKLCKVSRWKGSKSYQ